MLLLVPPDRHDVGIVNQNVRRHQHRIGEQAVVGREAVGNFVLVAVCALQQAHGVTVVSIHANSVTSGTSDWRKKSPLRVQTAGEEIQRHVQV